MAEKKYLGVRIVITCVLLVGAGVLYYWWMTGVDECEQLEKHTSDMVEALNRKDWVNLEQRLEVLWPVTNEGVRLTVDPNSRWSLSREVRFSMPSSSRADLVNAAKGIEFDSVSIERMSCEKNATGIDLFVDISSVQLATGGHAAPSKWKLVFKRDSKGHLGLVEIVLL